MIWKHRSRRSKAMWRGFWTVWHPRRKSWTNTSAPFTTRPTIWTGWSMSWPFIPRLIRIRFPIRSVRSMSTAIFATARRRSVWTWNPGGLSWGILTMSMRTWKSLQTQSRWSVSSTTSSAIPSNIWISRRASSTSASRTWAISFRWRSRTTAGALLPRICPIFLTGSTARIPHGIPPRAEAASDFPL